MVGLHGVYICWDGCAGEGTGGSSCLTGSTQPLQLNLYLRPSGYVIELVEYLEIMAWGVNASNRHC